MPFFVVHDLHEITPGWVEVWSTPFPTREAAEAAARTVALEGAPVIIEATTGHAALEQAAAQVAAWSR